MKQTILVLILALLLTACAQEPPKPEHLQGKLGEITITLDAPAKEVLQQLGAPIGYSESVSCAFEGKDKSYVYQSLCLRTYPAPDGERIAGFWFQGKNGATAEGITMGDDRETVKKIYGDFQGDTCSVTQGEETLLIVMNQDKVSAIVYSID